MTPRRAGAPDGPTRAGHPKDAVELLAQHCLGIGAEGAAILRVRPDGRVEIVAAHPAPQRGVPPPDWLGQAVQAAGAAAAADAPAVRPLHDADALYGQQARRQLVLAPLPTAGGDRAVVAFAKQSCEPSELARQLEELMVQVPAVCLYALHAAAGAPRRTAPRLEPALAALAGVNEHDRFLAAAMAFCNELAAAWRCERVSLGLSDGRSVRLRAMSHTERFSRKTRAVQVVEEAMEECLDQDLEVAWPAPAEAEYVARGAKELSAEGDGLAVLSLPVRRRGLVAGVVTLERAPDRPFEPQEAETLRLTCELCGPRLLGLREQDRWIGAKAGAGLRRVLAGVVGPRHTWAKLAAVAAAAVAAWLASATGDYRVEAPFVLEAARQQVVPAPFSGQIEAVWVDLGDDVAEGQLLAKLRTLPLERALNSAKAELFEWNKQADSARADKKWAEAQMAAARAGQLREQVALLAEQIDEASLRANLAGRVVQGDLRRFVGSAVEKGQVLFEIAPLDQLRAELSVPADQVGDLLAALRRGEVPGRLATASFPDRKVEVVVERVDPTAVERDGRTVFQVRTRLLAGHDWMRPGMEGVAHVTVERRRLVWVWTRRLANRLRLWLWL